MHDDFLRVKPEYDSEGNIIPLDEDAFSQSDFGARAAEQVGALAEMDFAERKASAFADGAGTADGSAKPRKDADYREALRQMSFDERVEATVECLGRRGTFRDILYGLLGFCTQERSYDDIEPYVESFTEFHRNRQEPRRYVFMLLRTGALEEIELGEDGSPLTEADRQAAIEGGLDPQDVDLLVFDWRVATTDVGRKVLEDYDPAARFKRLLADDPEREGALVRVMAFCRTPRSMGEIDDKFKGDALMGFDGQSGQMRQPSSYVGKLESAGMVFWDGRSWILTEEGAACLEGREGTR